MTALNTFSGQYKVFDGTLDVTTGYGVVYSVANETDCDVSINSSTGVYTISQVNSDNASAVFAANYAGASRYCTFTIAKSRELSGSGSSKRVLLDCNNFDFLYNENNQPQPETATLTVNRFNLSVAPVWTLRKLDGTVITSGTSSTLVSNGWVVSGTATQIIINEANFLALISANDTNAIIVDVTCTESGVDYSDRVTLFQLVQRSKVTWDGISDPTGGKAQTVQRADDAYSALSDGEGGVINVAGFLDEFNAAVDETEGLIAQATAQAEASETYKDAAALLRDAAEDARNDALAAKTQAQAAAVAAEDWSSAASTSASVASSSAAAAVENSASAQQSATLAASLATGSLVKNPAFSDYPTSDNPGYPTGWSNWTGSSPQIARSAGRLNSPYCVSMIAASGENCGIKQTVGGPDGNNRVITNGQYLVIEAVVRLSGASGGSLEGAGVYVNTYNVDNTAGGSLRLSFSIDPDTTGSVVGAGVIGRLYRFAKLVRVDNPQAYYFTIYAMTSYSGFGSQSTYRNLEWQQCSVRYATDQEIASQKATSDISSLNSSVATNASAIATTNATVANHTTSLNAAFSGLVNMVPNGDFSNGLTGYYNPNGFFVQTEWNGQRAVYNSTGSPVLKTPPFKVNAGTTITVGATKRSDGRSSHPLVMQIEWRSDPSAILSLSPTTSTVSNYRMILTQMVPTGAEYASVRFYSSGSDSGYVDLVNITAVAGNTDVPFAPSVGTNLTMAANVSSNASTIATNSSALATLKSRVQSGTPNLLPNSTFEKGTEGWSITSGYTLSSRNDTTWGSYGYTNNTITNTVTINSSKVAISPSTSYTVSGDIAYTSTSTSSYCYLDVLYYDSGGSLVLDGGQTIVYANQGFSSSGDRPGDSAYTTTSPSNAATAVVRLVIQPAGGTVSFAAIRRIKFEKGGSWTQWTSEATVNNLATALTSVEGRTRAYWEAGTAVPGAEAFVKIVSENTSGSPTSDVGIGAKTVSLWNTGSGTAKLAMYLSGGNATFTGKLNAGAGIVVGTGAWPVALAPKDFAVSDGTVVSFGFDFGYVPNITFNGPCPVALSSGEVYAPYADNVSSTGFTARLKIYGSPSTTSQSTGTGSSSGTNQFDAHKTAGDASNGIYNVSCYGTVSTAAYLDNWDDCVHVDAYVPSGKLAGDVVQGDELEVLTEDREGYETLLCHRSYTSEGFCYRIHTVSGIKLTCSNTTPITLRDGREIDLLDVLGKDVAVLDNGEFRWEEVVALEKVGLQPVQRISVHNSTYAAGDEMGRFIFTHNIAKN